MRPRVFACNCSAAVAAPMYAPEINYLVFRLFFRRHFKTQVASETSFMFFLACNDFMATQPYGMRGITSGISPNI